MRPKQRARKNYGKLLRRIRLKRGMSVRQLAKRIGVDHTYISKVERDRTAPPWRRMHEIAVLLDSPELRDVGEHAMIRRLLTLTENILVECKGLPLHLRKEIGLSQIDEMENVCAVLMPKMLAALNQRPETDWGSIGKPVRVINVVPLAEPVPRGGVPESVVPPNKRRRREGKSAERRRIDSRH
jgi:DNA-binding XRE family transcriptional regulator